MKCIYEKDRQYKSISLGQVTMNISSFSFIPFIPFNFIMCPTSNRFSLNTLLESIRRNPLTCLHLCVRIVITVIAVLVVMWLFAIALFLPSAFFPICTDKREDALANVLSYCTTAKDVQHLSKMIISLPRRTTP